MRPGDPGRNSDARQDRSQAFGRKRYAAGPEALWVRRLEGRSEEGHRRSWVMIVAVRRRRGSTAPAATTLTSSARRRQGS